MPGGGEKLLKTSSGVVCVSTANGDISGRRSMSFCLLPAITPKACMALDCMPREDLRRIRSRDRHAGRKDF